MSLNLTPLEHRPEKILGKYTCIRPRRLHGPRFEILSHLSKIIIHNYGHSGIGVAIGYGSSKFMTT